MISIPINTVKNNIVTHKSEIDDYILKAQNKIAACLKNEKAKLTTTQKAYLKELSSRLPVLVYAKPNKLKSLEKSFLKLPKNKAGEKVSFKDKVLNLLNYDGLRGGFFPIYFNDLGIKSCVYCNSQLTVCVENSKKKKVARFQLDHYIPKTKYPFLSVSLYNLYPVCASCNLLKDENRVDFLLYSDAPNTNDFKFKLKRGVVAKFLSKRDLNQIDFDYICPKAKPPAIDFETLFSIHSIHKTQLDIAEELILKAEVYKKSYKDSLIKKFPKIFSNTNITNRLIIGNYHNPLDIHKRPMAKFTQDISRQLGLIPKI